MDTTDARTGTDRRYYRVVISREKWRWLPSVVVTAPVLRFSDSGRGILDKAQEEARALDHNYIGTEHILLGTNDETGAMVSAVACPPKIDFCAAGSFYEGPKGGLRAFLVSQGK